MMNSKSVVKFIVSLLIFGALLGSALLWALLTDRYYIGDLNNEHLNSGLLEVWYSDHP